MTRLLSRPHAVASLLLLAAAAAAAATRPISEKDLLKFHWIADPQISPDGRDVAYVLVTVNEKEDRYDTSIWLVPAAPESAPAGASRS